MKRDIDDERVLHKLLKEANVFPTEQHKHLQSIVTKDFVTTEIETALLHKKVVVSHNCWNSSRKELSVLNKSPPKQV